MKPLKTLKKRLFRTSFQALLPTVAFALSLVVAAAVLTLQMYLSLQQQKTQTDTVALRLASAIERPLAENDLAEVNFLLEKLAPGQAQLLLDDGNIAGTERDLSGIPGLSETAVAVNGASAGTLRLAPLTPFEPIPSVNHAILMTFGIALLAALSMLVFSRMVARYVGVVTEIVDDFSLKRADGPMPRTPVFSEFRQLNTATIRATRRIAREIQRLKRTARTDSRTGLLNEGYLDSCIEAILPDATFKKPAALIVLEFGGYADKVDRISGEKMLQRIAKALRNTIRQCERSRGLQPGSWAIAALPSERFAVLADDFGIRDDLAAIVREIQAAFRAPIMIDEHPVALTLGGSIVVIPEDGDGVAQIRQRAIDTLLDLRRQNKPGFAFYSPKLERQRDALIKLEAELRTAVNEDRFIPLFQPKIDLKTGRVVGVEALARWQLENGRLVSPSVFIEMAEETGLIGAIGDQILRKACLDAADWNRAGHPISLAVNVSPVQFEDEKLTQTILDAIAKSGLPPRRFQIEITESLAIAHPERVKSVIAPLRKMGIQLAIDDFGTGHSNLATLTRLDFDVFKIDRAFVSGVPDDTHANAIVEMILSMANTLQMEIVGEGIETQAQADFLAARSCQIGQGFLYSPPIAAADLLKMLNSQPFMEKRLRA